MIKSLHLVFLSFFFLFLSCERSIGFGVLLWPEDNSTVSAGTVVKILSESRLNQSYEYRPLDTPSQVSINYPKWRIAFYSSRSKAESFSKAYEPYRYMLGSSMRNALPIRQTDDRLSRIVYRMREKEICKILERGKQSNEAGMVDYWYKILTQEGITGWIFGYYLNVYLQHETDNQEAVTEVDKNIDLLLQYIWRPAYFQQMIEEQNIILEYFNKNYGLFPDPEKNRLILATAMHTVTFPYTELRKIRSNLYLAIGTSLQVLFVNDSTISLTYELNDKEYSIALSVIEGDIADIIAKELRRRNIMYQSLLAQGPSLVSEMYGSITIFPDRLFSWTGHETFSSTTLPGSFSGTGRISFDIALSKDIADTDKYDGAFILFETSQVNSQVLHFMYTLVNKGLRLTYIPHNLIKKNIIQQVPISPVILFFSFSNI